MVTADGGGENTLTTTTHDRPPPNPNPSYQTAQHSAAHRSPTSLPQLPCFSLSFFSSCSCLCYRGEGNVGGVISLFFLRFGSSDGDGDVAAEGCGGDRWVDV